MRISVVTLTCDNPGELELTLRSVCLQTVRPYRHIVVDSSNKDAAKKAQSLAQDYGAEYFWTPPQGIYAAMQFSLDLLEDQGYALWLNSSDWLAGPDSLGSFGTALSRSSESVAWVCGSLVRWSRSEFGLHKGFGSKKKALLNMRLGYTGFPHPSTLFSVRKLKQIGGYKYFEDFDLAADLAVALRFGELFGPPEISHTAVSVHVPEGTTRRNRLPAFFERLIARATIGPPAYRAISLLVAVPLALWSLAGALNGRRQSLRSRYLHVPGGCGHYCEAKLNSAWPECCARSLGVPGEYPDLFGMRPSRGF